ncbi:MAG TPA: cytochrome c3 family protein [Anaeromyxobacter sp.]
MITSLALAVLLAAAPAKPAAKAASRPPAVKVGPVKASSAAPAEANPRKLKPGATGKICLECHADFQEKLDRKFVHTPVRAQQCTDCHSPHAASHGKMLSEEPSRICASCHGDVQPTQARSTHPPVAKSNCVACHDPHGSSAKNNLVKEGRELCAGCHKELVARTVAAKVKHRPVEQGGCTTCHQPHGSATAGKLLEREVPDLCARCHKVDQPIFAKQHGGYPVGKARCTSCHDPHGSDARGMLYDQVHAPVANGMCARCHDAPQTVVATVSGGKPVFKTRQQGSALCAGCHSEKVNAMMAQGRVHRPLVEGQGCLTCHNPHATTQRKLVKANLVAVCGTCHADTIGRQQRSPTPHAPVRDGDCGKCHDPHGGSAALMLRKADPIELCGTCHDWQKHSTHPVGAKYKDPRNPNLTLQCLSCHRAHGTEYKHLMPYAATTDLCTKCHEKFKR